MSITILNYHDQSLVDSVVSAAAERAAAERAAAEQAALDASSDFDAVLDETTQALSTENTYQPVSSAVSASNDSPEQLNAFFEEAAATYGVSCNLLKSIAKAESGFQANAVSSAGAVGIMQLMPATAASLGVSNSYDARENIMGGANLIGQLLNRYNGDTSLALAAYNAGSGNVDKYGGIPPFTETQNYVQKVLSYLGDTVTVADASPTEYASSASTFSEDTGSLSSLDSGLTGNEREEANALVENILNSKNISKDTLELLNILLKVSQSQTSA